MIRGTPSRSNGRGSSEGDTRLSPERAISPIAPRRSVGLGGCHCQLCRGLPRPGGLGSYRLIDTKEGEMV